MLPCHNWLKMTEARLLACCMLPHMPTLLLQPCSWEHSFWSDCSRKAKLDRGAEMKCSNLFLQERSGLPNTARVAAFGYQDHVQTLPWPPFSPKRLVLNVPEDMLHNMFIRGSHNHWPLHSWKIFSSRKKVILQQRIKKVVQSTQRGWLFASCPQETIPSMKHID